ncbi:MAG: hypothetical protein CMH83_01505 [Nocardioides sp.]|nr:hypothetical protein [Nocardioides sp.]
MAATVVGALLPLWLDHEPAAAPTGTPTSTGTATLASGTARGLDELPHAPADTDSGARTTGDAAERRATTRTAADDDRDGARKLGVATYALDPDLALADVRAGAAALTDRDGVSVVGWQGTATYGNVFGMLDKAGWDTLRPDGDRDLRDLAVSWRRDRFELAGWKAHPVAEGATRQVLRVSLRERSSGDVLSVLVAQVPDGAASTEQPGRWAASDEAVVGRETLRRYADMWDKAPGRWGVGTLDLGLDAFAEADAAPVGGPTRHLADVAASTYDVRGRKGVDAATDHTEVVYVRRTDLDRERLSVRGQTSMDDLAGTTHPVIGWLQVR